jgi:hypothetical protein
MSGECNNCDAEHTEFECLLAIAEELASQLYAWKELHEPNDPEANKALDAFEEFKRNVTA